MNGIPMHVLNNRESVLPLEQELRERSDTSESDLGKVSDATGRIETQETVNELVKTKEGLLRDIEFLDENADRGTQRGYPLG